MEITSRRQTMDVQMFGAAEEGDMKILETYNAEQVSTTFLTPTSNTILHVYLTAQIEPSTQTVQLMLGNWPFLGSQANGRRDTPLHIAARYGQLDTVRLLLNHAKSSPPPDYDHQQDVESGIVPEEEEEVGKKRTGQLMRRTNKDGDTALHEAVRRGESQVVSLLVGEEDGEYMYMENRGEESPLYMAAERGNLEMARIILAAFKYPAHFGPYRRTAAHVAVIRGDKEMVGAILETEKLRHLTGKADDQGWTPLHYAAYNLSEMIVEMLLDYDKSAAYTGDNHGNRAVHIAVTRPENGVVTNCFLRECPDSFELVDHKGRSALHLAAQSGSEQAVSLILKKNSLRHLINLKDDKGNTPLHLMLASGKYNPSLFFDPRVDNMAFNNNHLSPLDLIPPHLLQTEGLEIYRKNVGLRALKVEQYDHKKDDQTEMKMIQMDNDRANPIDKESNVDVEKLKETAKETHLIVATLIATVTFAAGIAMPGGYNQEQGHDVGVAVLSRSEAFKAFVISDTIAFVLSCAAVFIYLVVAMNTNRRITEKMFNNALTLTVYALLAMVIAFITGTYAVLPHPSPLADAASVLGCLFFLLYSYIFASVIYVKIGQGLLTCVASVACLCDFLCCQDICG